MSISLIVFIELNDYAIGKIYDTILDIHFIENLKKVPIKTQHFINQTKKY